MVSTPQRTQLNSSVFSPVRGIEQRSPAAASSSSSATVTKSDQLGLRPRIRTICRSLVDNHQKWLAVVRRGTVLCAQIEAIKLRALDEVRHEQQNGAGSERVGSDAAAAPATVYPDELRTPCAKFQVICTILDDVLAASQAAERQLVAIELLQTTASSAATEQPAPVETAVFKTWPVHRFVGCVRQLVAGYAAELPERKRCMQEIAHAQNREELALHTAVWEWYRGVGAGAGSVDVEVLGMRYECDLEETASVAVAAAAAGPGHRREKH